MANTLTEQDFLRMAREVWEDCGGDQGYTMPVPEVLRPYVLLDERGYFAGFDRGDGVVDAYERAARRLLMEQSARLWAKLPRPRREVV